MKSFLEMIMLFLFLILVALVSSLTKLIFSLHNALDAYKHSPNLISVQNFVWILMFSLNFMHIIFVSRQQYNEVTSTRNGFIMVCSSFLEVFFSRDGQDDLALLALSST